MEVELEGGRRKSKGKRVLGGWGGEGCVGDEGGFDEDFLVE